ncbi:MAG: hypothetical protein HYU66_14870, partial [Armatimonadetes bacterium]|nr:hypothetical protein [Armatimonadota bacterium]
MSCAAAAPAITAIRALPDRLVVDLAGAPATVRIVELRPWQSTSRPGAGSLAWEGRGPGEVTIPRFVRGRDRLYGKFVVVSPATGRPLGPAHWVTDLDALPAWDFAIPWPASKKGISCPVDLDDLQALGARYADDGFILAALFDWSPGPWRESWEVDGQRIAINLDFVHDLDRRIKRLTDLGINMTLIPVNGVP